jgi:hypothetical protein
MSPQGPQLKGQLLLARIDYLRDTHGSSALERVLADLAEGDRELLATARRDGWYPFGTLVRLDHAVARVLAGGDPEMFDRLGEASARHRTEWLGEHASLVSVHGFLSRVAEDHRRFQDFGRAIYRRTGFTSAELAFSEYPELDESYCRSARGYFRASVTILTGSEPVVEELRCQRRGDPACVFSICWTGRTEGSG